MDEFVYFMRRTRIWIDGVEEIRFPVDAAAALTDETHTCVPYISPDRVGSIRGGKRTPYDGRSADCWVLGVLLASLLSGSYPFQGPIIPEIFKRISEAQFSLPKTISLSAQYLIRSLLQKSPSERLTASEILKHSWMKESQKPKEFHNSSKRMRLDGSFSNNSNDSTYEFPSSPASGFSSQLPSGFFDQLARILPFTSSFSQYQLTSPRVSPFQFSQKASFPQRSSFYPENRGFQVVPILPTLNPQTGSNKSNVSEIQKSRLFERANFQ